MEAVLAGKRNVAGCIAKGKLEALWIGGKFWDAGDKLEVKWVDEGEEFMVRERNGKEALWLWRVVRWWKA